MPSGWQDVRFSILESLVTLSIQVNIASFVWAKPENSDIIYDSYQGCIKISIPVGRFQPKRITLLKSYYKQKLNQKSVGGFWDGPRNRYAKTRSIAWNQKCSAEKPD